MLNLPAELGWVSENLPFGPRMRLGPQGRFSLTHPRSAGRFIPNQPNKCLLYQGAKTQKSSKLTTWPPKADFKGISKQLLLNDSLKPNKVPLPIYKKKYGVNNK